MKIRDFIIAYNALEPEDRAKYVKMHVINKYVGYSSKVQLCSFILHTTSYTKTPNGRMIYTPDSTAEYLLYVITLIGAYTDLTFYSNSTDDQNDNKISKEWIEQFEALEECGALDIFLNKDSVECIPYTEIEKFNSILQMIKNDISYKEEGLVHFLETKFETLSIVFEKQLDGILSLITKIINENDLDSLSNIVNFNYSSEEKEINKK